MPWRRNIAACCVLIPIRAVSAADTESSMRDATEDWNFHLQNTDVVQGYPGFDSKYAGTNSLPSGGETRETVSVDVMGGVRLWQGAEGHIDGLMWQGFGLANTLGIEAFPSGEAYRLGTAVPNGAIARLFIQQSIGFGGAQEDVADGPVALAGKKDVSRLTLTLGRFAVPDIFDTNAYANDARTQFMNWAFVNNEAWDYPADTIGYDTGLAVELNQPTWTLRYGFFQVPSRQNGLIAADRFLKWPYAPASDGPSANGPFLQAWGMVMEFERRYALDTGPGAIRLLVYRNRADMVSYSQAIPILVANGPGANLSGAAAYRYQCGYGLNWEQAIGHDIGMFSRLGWNAGEDQAWMFTDVDYTASLGLRITGQSWHRPGDSFGLAGVASGISHVEQQFLQAGGLGILGGDGHLNDGWEKALEAIYDSTVWRTVHVAVDYQFISDPAFNRDRGPVSVFGLRLHWER